MEDGNTLSCLIPYYDMFNHSVTNNNAKMSRTLPDENENSFFEFYATQDIHYGEEILYNYKDGVVDANFNYNLALNFGFLENFDDLTI